MYARSQLKVLQVLSAILVLVSAIGIATIDRVHGPRPWRWRLRMRLRPLEAPTEFPDQVGRWPGGVKSGAARRFPGLSTELVIPGGDHRLVIEYIDAFTERVDINRAGVGELGVLPGIGPTLAKRIVEERASHGRYRSIRDLLRVRGLGRRTLARIEGLITCGEGE